MDDGRLGIIRESSRSRDLHQLRLPRVEKRLECFLSVGERAAAQELNRLLSFILGKPLIRRFLSCRFDQACNKLHTRARAGLVDSEASASTFQACADSKNEFGLCTWIS